MRFCKKAGGRHLAADAAKCVMGVCKKYSAAFGGEIKF